MSDKIAVLFVCLGNICRSPTAEAVFKKKAHDAGLDLIIDSAGTHGYHIGSPPDKRSQSAGTDRGYSFRAGTGTPWVAGIQKVRTITVRARNLFLR